MNASRRERRPRAVEDRESPATGRVPTDDTGRYLIGIPEFGRRLGVSRSGAYALVRIHGVQLVPVGARRLVPVAEAERVATELLAGARPASA